MMSPILTRLTTASTGPAADVASTFAPSRTSVNAVRRWLLDSGIEDHRIKLSPSGGWLEFKATTREAEESFTHELQCVRTRLGCRTHRYHLPEHLVPHVDFVTPTVHFDAKLSKRSGGDGQPSRSLGQPGNGNGPKTSGGPLSEILDPLEHCDRQITPACLRALYGFVYQPKVPEKNSYGIVEYAPQSYRQADLNLFASKVSPDLYDVSPKMIAVDGGSLSSQASIGINLESSLDLEYAMSLVTKAQNVTLYQVGDLVGGGSFNNFLDALDGHYCTFEGGDDPKEDGVYPDKRPGGYTGPKSCGTVKPANVISTSYGDNEAHLTRVYASRQCAEYGKLGLMGVTFLFSSGDTGVAGNGNRCLDPNGFQSVFADIFNPTFPSTCPYVTSVGATQIDPGKTVLDPESACEQVIFSGGGFSNYFGLPDYQKDAVTSYLKNTPPSYPGNIWNSTGKSRAYPDISANGANYVVAVDDHFTLTFGTSASTPVVGAMLTMVNDARIALGKRPVGFINHLIYSANFSDAFNDITAGTNPGCGTPGFNTSRGWDPVTGLGTPNFPKLLSKWIALP
ncbi:peptidase S8/S53 domain-containing protein [Chiua virens]|nr:peptidase S8/S53 domain-containing protein [Chiua virens]